MGIVSLIMLFVKGDEKYLYVKTHMFLKYLFTDKDMFFLAIQETCAITHRSVGFYAAGRDFM